MSIHHRVQACVSAEFQQPTSELTQALRTEGALHGPWQVLQATPGDGHLTLQIDIGQPYRLGLRLSGVHPVPGAPVSSWVESRATLRAHLTVTIPPAQAQERTGAALDDAVPTGDAWTVTLRSIDPGLNGETHLRTFLTACSALIPVLAPDQRGAILVGWHTRAGHLGGLHLDHTVTGQLSALRASLDLDLYAF